MMHDHITAHQQTKKTSRTDIFVSLMCFLLPEDLPSELIVFMLNSFSHSLILLIQFEGYLIIPPLWKNGAAVT